MGELKAMAVARCKAVPEVSGGAGVAPAGVLLLTKKRTFFHKKTNNKMLMRLLSSEKTNKKKIPKKIFPSPQYFKMMVLLLYIQNQDKQKNDQKNQIKFPEKKNSESCYYPIQPQKNPSTTTKNFATRHNFFLQVMNKNTRKKEK